MKVKRLKDKIKSKTDKIEQKLNNSPANLNKSNKKLSNIDFIHVRDRAYVQKDEADELAKQVEPQVNTDTIDGDHVHARVYLEDENVLNLAIDVKKLEKVVDKPRHIHTQKLQKRILDLVKKHKLTKEELAGYLCENTDIFETEFEIRHCINNLENNNKISTLTVDNDKILCPVSDSPKYRIKWETISRTKSREWIEGKTTLNSFFYKVRQTYNNTIKKLDQSGLNCYNKTLSYTTNPMEVYQGRKKCILFSSNDYLGLSRHPEVLSEVIKILPIYGMSTGGSRIMIGTTPIHLQLEKELSEFLGVNDVITFNSGFLTNIALASVSRKDCAIFFDSLDHASILDGIKLSGTKAIPFHHNNLEDLEKKLYRYRKLRHKFVIIESVYSLEGDIAKIADISDLCKNFGCYLAIDEAHSFGVLGDTGRGILEHFNLPEDTVDFKMGVLSKSLGGQGGYIGANKRIIDALKYYARPFLFSTSPPAALLGGVIKSLNIIQNQPSLIKQLQQTSKTVRNQINSIGFDTGNSETQIIPIIIGDDEKTHKIQRELQELGVFVNAVTYPAVPKRTSRLRICISAAHSKNHIDQLLESLKKINKNHFN